MPNPVSCRTCGATDVAVYTGTTASSGVIPAVTLAWAVHLHPKRRIIGLVTAVDANVLPFLALTLIRHPETAGRDDLWGIAGLFAGCSAAAFMIGAIVNNFRKPVT